MHPRLRRLLVMVGGAVVAAAVSTLVLAPPGTLLTLGTFLVLLATGAAVLYVVGNATTEHAFGTGMGPMVSVSTSSDHTPRQQFEWVVREAAGLALTIVFGLLLLAVFLAQTVTHWTDAPLLGLEADTEVGVWTLIWLLGVACIVLGLWRLRHGEHTTSHNRRDGDGVRWE